MSAWLAAKQTAFNDHVHVHVHVHVHAHAHVLMRDEREGRKKQARSNKQQGKATQHTQIHVHVYPYLFIVMNLWFGSLSLSAVTGIYDTLKSTTQKTKRTCFLTFGVGVYPDSLLVVVGLALIHVHCTCFEWESHVCFFALLFVDLASFFLMQLSLKHVHCTCIHVTSLGCTSQPIT